MTNKQFDTPVDSESFLQLLKLAEKDSKIRPEIAKLFAREAHKALEQGRICTDERMAALYPIFREINQETDETEAFWNKVLSTDKRRRKPLKTAEVRNA